MDWRQYVVHLLSLFPSTLWPSVYFYDLADNSTHPVATMCSLTLTPSPGVSTVIQLRFSLSLPTLGSILS